jgi:hypothetical protein
MVIDLIRLIGSKFKATRVSYFAVAVILGLQMWHIVCLLVNTLLFAFVSSEIYGRVGHVVMFLPHVFCMQC